MFVMKCEEEEQEEEGGEGRGRPHVVSLVEVDGAGDGGEAFVAVGRLRVHRRGNTVETNRTQSVSM